MGDGGTGIFKFENRIDVEVVIPESSKMDIQAARRTLDDAVRRIPESALRGFRGFRISVMA
jgi:hypothetical protein